GSGRAAGAGELIADRAGSVETEGRRSEEPAAAPTRRPTIGVASAATASASTARRTALLIFIMESSLKSCADKNKDARICLPSAVLVFDSNATISTLKRLLLRKPLVL